MSKKISLDGICEKFQDDIFASLDKVVEKYRKKFVGRTATFGENVPFDYEGQGIVVTGKITDVILDYEHSIDEANLIVVIVNDVGQEFEVNVGNLDWVGGKNPV